VAGRRGTDSGDGQLPGIWGGGVGKDIQNSKDGKILIARRKEGTRFANKWEFPGGRVEVNESPEECLKRELREELGIETEVGEFICSSRYDYGDFEVELLAYRVAHLSGEFRLNDHDEIRWALPLELKDYDFPEADAPIVKELMQK